MGGPSQSRDHERARLAYQTAVAEPDGVDTGWLGRARSAYATLLGDRLQIPSQLILGGEFARLKLV